MMSVLDSVLSERSALKQSCKQAKQVLRTIRDDAQTLEEAKILAQTIVGKQPPTGKGDEQ